MKTLLHLSTALCALMSAAPALAEGAPNLDALVVTANRTAVRADQVGGQITVIDQAAIRAQQTPVVSDLLQRTPGVSVSRNGGVGAATQLRIRGAETDQTVVLIDGVKLNDPSGTGGGYNFANLLIGDIERIEVLRGAQSVLWGSQAIGGVVNILTRDPAQPFEATAAAEAGSLGTALGRLGLGGRGERLIWRATAGYFTTRGISVFDRARGGRERDGYRNLGASAKARILLTGQLSLDLRGVYSRGRGDLDGFPPPAFNFGDTTEYGRTTEWIVYAGLNADLLDGRFSSRLAVAYTDTDRDNFNPAQAVTPRTFDSAGRNRRFEYQGAFRVAPRWTAVFGAESERSKMRTASPSSFTPDPPTLRRTAQLDGVYGQLAGEVAPGLTLTGGLRYDDHGDFGGHTVAQASAAWVIRGATVLRASFGQGFKAPTLYQLGSEFGNGALDPEESDSWDAGVQRSFAAGRIMLSAAYFQRRTRGQIDFFSCAATATTPLCFGPAGAPRFGYYDNVGRTKAQGVELEGRARVSEALTLMANYTWTDAVNDTPGSLNRGRRLQRRPAHQAYAEAAYVWPGGLTTSIAVQYVGLRSDDAGARTRLGAYSLWDVRLSYPVTAGIELYGRVENLFDKRYETVRNYGQPGRAAYAGVRAKF